MPLCYNRLSPTPGIYGHQRGRSSVLVEMFGAERRNGRGHLYFGVQNTHYSKYFPDGYRDPKYGSFSCSFLICSSCLTVGHFDCDLYTMRDRKTRKKGYFYIVSDLGYQTTLIRRRVSKS